MTLLASSPAIDASPPALTDASRRAPDRERGPRNKASGPSGAFCLRCGRLLVPSYPATLESDFRGRPMTLWRRVNCGDCFDSQILANRRKETGPTDPYARSRTGRPRPGRPPRQAHGVGYGVQIGMTQ
jgi:hypothetical protein